MTLKTKLIIHHLIAIALIVYMPLMILYNESTVIWFFYFTSFGFWFYNDTQYRKGKWK